MDELKSFRQLHSKTPGHPEYGYAPGVETTTGPLGQGITNAVGMAIAEKTLAAQFNRPGKEIVNHYTYVFLGDGCLMEGISHEACSLAGTLGLGKLIGFYDDNGISIDGEVEGWFTDDTPGRFKAYGWHVIPDVDGHDSDAIKAAVEQARAETGRPTMICCKTIIGWGSPNKQGKEECHGAALGEDEVALVRETIGWEHDPFVIPEDIRAGWDARGKGKDTEGEWNSLFDAYRSEYPDLAAEFERRIAGDLPADWSDKAEAFIASVVEKAASIPSRKASQQSIEGYAAHLPELLGGSADLAGSNLTMWSGSKPLSRDDSSGNYIYYGVREFGMSAIVNGIALHGGFIPYGGTFLMFSEYARNALRMAALMKIRSLFVYTHDSIGLGEDGPTHQPVEQIATLRLIPRMTVWRPCDAVETAIAWKMALENSAGPSCLIFSRQKLVHEERTPDQLANVSRGGYILRDTDGKPDCVVIATGSEVGIAREAAEQLASEGKQVRVVSMPSTKVFDAQDEGYRESVLPSDVTARVAVEAGVTDFWLKYVGLGGKVVGIDTFGESAPGGTLMKEFGFTVDNVVKAVNATLSR
jgi:transketolase